MPFTAAHPMAILPLLRVRLLDATCLVTGAMAPDFEYFLHGQQQGYFGHTWRGVPGFSVPAAIVIAVVFHLVVKWPLVLVAPRALARRLAPWATRPWITGWTSLPRILVAATLGVLSHLAWDGLTHANGWGERYITALRDPIDVPLVGSMVGFRALQYACSVLGLAVVGWYAVRALRRTAPAELPDPPRALARAAFAACLAAATGAVLYRALHVLHAHDPGSKAVATIAGLLAGTLVASALTYPAAQRLRA
jgi:hypothetical protein